MRVFCVARLVAGLRLPAGRQARCSAPTNTTFKQHLTAFSSRDAPARVAVAFRNASLS